MPTSLMFSTGKVGKASVLAAYRGQLDVIRIIGDRNPQIMGISSIQGPPATHPHAPSWAKALGTVCLTGGVPRRGRGGKGGYARPGVVSLLCP